MQFPDYSITLICCSALILVALHGLRIHYEYRFTRTAMERHPGIPQHLAAAAVFYDLASALADAGAVDLADDYLHEAHERERLHASRRSS